LRTEDLDLAGDGLLSSLVNIVQTPAAMTSNLKQRLVHTWASVSQNASVTVHFTPVNFNSSFSNITRHILLQYI